GARSWRDVVLDLEAHQPARRYLDPDPGAPRDTVTHGVGERLLYRSVHGDGRRLVERRCQRAATQCELDLHGALDLEVVDQTQQCRHARQLTFAERRNGGTRLIEAELRQPLELVGPAALVITC